MDKPIAASAEATSPSAVITTERRFGQLPFITLFKHYSLASAKADSLAGLSVAAIQIPTAIAYASLAGFPPLVGLYACLLPLVVYALLGSSRQLILGPDSATCAMIAATLAPLAVAGSAHYIELSMLLALMVGSFSMIAGLLRLGFVADFLSRPILLGFMNGVALAIIASQLGKVLGLSIQAHVLFGILLAVVQELHSIHWPTVLMSSVTLAILVICTDKFPKWPTPLLIIVVMSGLSWAFQLQQQGITVVGAVTGGLPSLSWPQASYHEMRSLFGDALAIALVSFCSAMLTARSFAARGGYRIYPNQDLIALGAANITAGLSGGFVISGADSRTAVNNMVGGKTSLVNLSTAVYTGIAIWLFSDALGWIPVAVLGAVLIQAACKMIDLKELRYLRQLSRFEWRLSVLTTIGVVALGVLPGILFAILLALMNQLREVARPRDAVLGPVPNGRRLFNVAHAPQAERLPGVVVYRFDASLLFFNSDYFQQRVQSLVAEADEPIRALIFDAHSCPTLDVTGAMTLSELHVELQNKGIRFCVAAAHGKFREVLERAGLHHQIGTDNMFSTSLEALMQVQQDWEIG